MVWGATITLFGIIPVLWIGLSLLALAGAADVISAVFRQAVQQRTVPDHLQGRLSGTFFAVVAGGPAWAMPRPAWLGHRRSSVRGVVGRAGMHGRGAGSHLAGARAVAGPGGRPDPVTRSETQAIGQVTTELGEGEPL